MGVRIYLRSGGRLRQWRGDAEGIARAFAALPAAGAVALVAQGDGGDTLILRRDAGGAFRFRVIDRGGPGAIGYCASARRDHDAAAAKQLLTLYAGADPAWRTATAWRRSVFDLPVAILGPATILGGVVIYFAVAGATGGLQGWSWRYLPNLVVGVALIGAVFAYVDWFFRRLRKRLGAWLGRRFGLRIVESEELGFFARPGMWESPDGGIVSELKVTLLDFAVLLLGLMIPIFALGTAIVLAARPILE
ncbi:MAG TPA: hypothetical protein VIF14_07045 [Alphaproteobacteria bacterium]|jgi:hypothetical protein